MEKEDKIFEQFKSAADNAETKDFAAMDKVWSRVEDKLDNKKDKKDKLLWKKIAVAASLLLFTTLGYQFFKNSSNKIKSNETITATDTIKKATLKNAIVASDSVNPAIKKDAEQILQKQLIKYSKVAIAKNSETIKGELYPKPSSTTATSNQYWYSTTKTNSEDLKLESRKDDAKDVEMLIQKKNQVSNDKMEEPLVVINNKVEKKSIKEIEFDEADSLVVLKEPLYIINGIEYTEKEMFGPNPTSPYAPLKKQDIETLTILQDEKAIELYGNKGKKGVVIITTKNGKPVTASKKAK